MAIFITKNDFIGRYTIPTDAKSQEKLLQYIDTFEKKYLIDLLGASMYKNFIADYTAANPTAGVFSEPKYLAIFNEIIEDNGRNIVNSQGMKVMLPQFIFYEFMRDRNIKWSIGGPQINEQADSMTADYDATSIDNVFNAAIDNYRMIQYYIRTFNPLKYDYDEFNGIKKLYNTFL